MHLCVSIDQEINLDRNFRKLLKQNGNNIIKLIELDENGTEKQVSLHSIKSEITRREWKFISAFQGTWKWEWTNFPLDGEKWWLRQILWNGEKKDNRK